ncbi:unnamed protein product, partial [Callosobruchus maculatus]
MRVASLIAMAIVRTIPALSGNENCLFRVIHVIRHGALWLKYLMKKKII